MAHICREWMNSTTSEMFPLICQTLLSAGWVEHQTISSTSRVFKTTGKNNDMPPIYNHLYITSGTIDNYFYQHWNNGAGVCTVNGATTIGSTVTGIRMFANKHYYFISSSPFNGSPNSMMYPVSPLRTAQTVSHVITGGSSVTITLSSLEGFRLNDFKVIYGSAGEGQQAIKIVSMDTNLKTITVTGCTNNYAVGAIVGEYVVTFISMYSGNMCNAFPFNKNGTAASNNTVQIVGKNNNVGAIYTYENYIHLDVSIVADNNRYLGEIDSTYVKSARGCTANDVIQIINNDDPIIDSLVTSSDGYSLTDTTKNWVPDTLIGKTCIFISGTGSGFTRYIIGNTVNTITFRTSINIDTTTGFRIADEAYRAVYSPNSYFAIKEEI